MKTPDNSSDLDELADRPFTKEELARARRVPLAKTLRWRLKLTQEEFAERYRIPLGTLRDWEQGRSEPDAPSRAYLEVIAREPEIVARALKKTAA
ncbi:helix-turn-helix domain-containing protein [Terrarubrum flagellatum]|uniref:helix-turn-helix domain-containing protein n=1 Tax=Terrirubrum flagellatum TaxID=2895980 RepID=UPI0031457087